jgi:hypothetical protein
MRSMFRSILAVVAAFVVASAAMMATEFVNAVVTGGSLQTWFPDPRRVQPILLRNSRAKLSRLRAPRCCGNILL